MSPESTSTMEQALSESPTSGHCILHAVPRTDEVKRRAGNSATLQEAIWIRKESIGSSGEHAPERRDRARRESENELHEREVVGEIVRTHQFAVVGDEKIHLRSLHAVMRALAHERQKLAERPHRLVGFLNLVRTIAQDVDLGEGIERGAA